MHDHSSVKRPDDSFTNEEGRAWMGFLRVHALLVRQLDDDIQRAHHLPLTTYEALRHLSWAPGQRMRINDLAAACLLSQSGGSRLVERLVREGLVERAATTGDGRGAYAVLTPAGRARLDEAQATHIASVRARFLSHFTSEELESLAGYWQRVLAAQSGEAANLAPSDEMPSHPSDETL
jgi:DNA-binding MarR family transcriptional regulator